MDQVIQALSQKNKISPSVHDPLKLIAPLRMKNQKRKWPKSKKLLILVPCFKAVMTATAPKQNERVLEGLFLREISQKGTLATAYPGILPLAPMLVFCITLATTALCRRGNCY